MSNEAIQFSIGADNRGLLEVLADSEKAAKQSASAIGGHLRGMGKEGGERLGEIFEREGKVKRNLVGLVADLTQARTATDALAIGANRLGEVFKTGLGLGVGIGVAVEFTKALGETIKKTEELETRLRELKSATSGTGTNFQSAQELQSNLASSSEMVASLRGNQMESLGGKSFGGFIGSAWHNIGVGASGVAEILAANIAGDKEVAGSTVTENNQRRLKEAMESEARAREKVAEKESRVADIADLQLNGSSYTAAKAKLEMARDERLGSAEGNLGLQEAIRREFETAMDGLHSQEASRQRGYFFGETAAAIRQQRGDVNAGLAQNELNAAQAELKDASTSEDKDAASLKVKNAQIALDTARQTSEESRVQLESEQRLAQLRASSSDEQLEGIKEAVSRAEQLLGNYKDSRSSYAARSICKRPSSSSRIMNSLAPTRCVLCSVRAM